jgi:hypothetical protein
MANIHLFETKVSLSLHSVSAAQQWRNKLVQREEIIKLVSGSNGCGSISAIAISNARWHDAGDDRIAHVYIV